MKESDIIKRVVKQYNILKYKNVIGYSSSLKPRIKDNKEIPGTKCIRIYVTKKEMNLRENEMVPRVLNTSNGTFETDLVVTEIPKALQVDKTSKIRPVHLGVSIGHWDITSGSLGMLYKYKGQVVAGSNAHIVCDEPSKKQSEIVEKRILQPGAYFQGQKEENVVGYYIYHKPIVPVGVTNCKLAKFTVSILNGICRLFKRKGKFVYEVNYPNYIDFGAYIPVVEHTLKVADDSLSNEPFIGHLFAGSSDIGVICKAKYIMEEGFEPLIEATEVKYGDKVKGCSLWCNYTTTVEDESANIIVNYGEYDAWFEDIILVHNDGTIKGGWSGSGFRKLEG